MKPIKEISGIFFRVRNEETLKYENKAFEDLSESEQDEIMNQKDIEQIKNLAKLLANTINNIS